MNNLKLENGSLRLNLSKVLSSNEILAIEIIFKDNICLKFSREQLSVFLRSSIHLVTEKTAFCNKRPGSVALDDQHKERKLANQAHESSATLNKTFGIDNFRFVDVKCEVVSPTTVTSSICAPGNVLHQEDRKPIDYVSPYEGEAEWDEDLYCSKYDSSSDLEEEVDTLIDSDSDDSLAFSHADSSDIEIEEFAPTTAVDSFPVTKPTEVNRRVLRKAELNHLFDIEQEHLTVFINNVDVAHTARLCVISSEIECLSEKECNRVQAVEVEKFKVMSEGESALLDLILHHKQVVGATDNAFQHHCSAIQARQEAFATAEEAGELVACLMSGEVRPDGSTRRAALLSENELEMKTLVQFGRSDLAKLRVRQIGIEQHQRSSVKTRVADLERLSSIAKQAFQIRVEILTTEGALDADRTKALVENERARILAVFVATLSSDDVALFNE
jgi:hypothetical protein